VKLALIRHTAVDCAPGICYGRLDLPLAPAKAEGDIRAVCAQLAGFEAARLWSSPALRCRRLAEALGRPILDPRLVELDLGAWEGRPWDDVPRAELDRWAADPLGFAAPGGETGEMLVARVRSFFEELRATEGDHAVVSHGGPLRILSALAGGRAVDLLVPAPPLGSVEIVDL
jgi:alpha-ribazole phosphatase